MQSIGNKTREGAQGIIQAALPAMHALQCPTCTVLQAIQCLTKTKDLMRCSRACAKYNTLCSSHTANAAAAYLEEFLQ